jgi:hypothetical protein
LALSAESFSSREKASGWLASNSDTTRDVIEHSAGEFDRRALRSDGRRMRPHFLGRNFIEFVDQETAVERRT